VFEFVSAIGFFLKVLKQLDIAKQYHLMPPEIKQVDNDGYQQRK
jgi:hypothetical protein